MESENESTRQLPNVYRSSLYTIRSIRHSFQAFRTVEFYTMLSDSIDSEKSSYLLAVRDFHCIHDVNII